MPAPVAPFIGFALGTGFAWAAANVLAKGPGSGVTSRALLVVTLFSLLVFAPTTAYFLAFAPDWSYAYWVDSRKLPSAVGLGLVLLNLASVPIGFWAAARAARARALRKLVNLGLVALAPCVLFVVIGWQRFGVEGTYAQYHGDFGMRALGGSPLGYALLWMTLILAGATAWAARCLKKLV